MKHIIGIDAGTNSTGWALIQEDDDEKVELVDIGSYIFPIGTNVDPTSNAETTKNEQRRNYRGIKRNLFRYKLRRKKLKKLLGELKMLPNFEKTYMVKKKLQSLDLYEWRAKAIKEQIPLDEIGRIFLLLNKYRGFQSNAKKQIVEVEEKDKNKKEENKKVENGIKQLTDLINNTGAATIGEYYYLMHKKAKELYEKNKWHNPNELIDERLKNENGEIILYDSRGIRRQFGRYTGREMYQEEFDLIWKTQKYFYDKIEETENIFSGSAKEYLEIKKEKDIPKKIQLLKEYKETNYWQIRNFCIYYQRPLRSQKKYLSNCQFEKNKKVIPASHPLYQEFRIWKNLADLRYSLDEENIFNQPLPLEWRKIVFDYLMVNNLDNENFVTEKVYISKAKNSKNNTQNIYLKDLLADISANVVFKTEDEESEKYIKGNSTHFVFYQALGKEIYTELKEAGKLEKLWHHLYMATNDDWLKDTLLCKWKFGNDEKKHEAIVNKLIAFELEDNYGSFCAKTIKSILPYLQTGQDEYTAIESVIKDEKIKERKSTQGIKENISQLKYQELRNPVVEKSASQVIKIVNAILEKYKDEINREKLEIRIESTRELKKPRQQREKLLREIRKKDEIREEYANFLNKKREEGKLQFNRKIYKNDSIIGKFELWLEMGYDKDDDGFIEFSKVEKPDEKQKHTLWLECGRLCPYTGKPINLTALFSPVTEIEHIIPLSRSLDDSFNNKTLTFTSINHEKGNRTAFEYMQWKNDLDNFKKRIKYFSDAKKEFFLMNAEDAANKFTNNQLGNTGYITKYLRKKMMEVTPSVQFTVGSATAQLRNQDWKLSNLLDKIRFEEEKGIDIDSYLQQLKMLRKDFFTWYRKKENSTDVKINLKTISPEIILEYEKESRNNFSECIEMVNQFDEFRKANNKSLKKNRSDHRHHAIDAFITACCSRSITQYLSTYNRVREEQGLAEYSEHGGLNREEIERPFDYEQLKQKIKEILVCHNIGQKLITSRKNKHKTKNGIKEQKTFAPQGALHKEGLYGKLKNPERQGIDKKDAFVKRIPIFQQIGTTKTINFKTMNDLDKVYDKNVKEILRRRIEKYGSGEKAFSKEALVNDPLYLYSLKKYPNGFKENEIPISRKKDKPLPVIKNVRVLYKNSRNLIQLKAKDEYNIVVNENRYAETEGNYIMALYELKQFDKKGKERKPLRDFRLLSFFEAVERKRKGGKLFSDEIERDGKHLPLMKDCHWLKQGDLIVRYEDEEIQKKILKKDTSIIIPRMYKIAELNQQVNVDKKTGKESPFGVLKLVHVNKVKTQNDKYGTEGNFIKILHTGINAIKVRLTPLGEIEKIGEECFEKRYAEIRNNSSLNNSSDNPSEIRSAL